jgi:hypothetical protein
MRSYGRGYFLPPGQIGCGGRDEYGPYLGCGALHRGMMGCDDEDGPGGRFVLAAKR